MNSPEHMQKDTLIIVYQTLFFIFIRGTLDDLNLHWVQMVLEDKAPECKM